MSLLVLLLVVTGRSLQAQDACTGVTATRDLVVLLVEGDPIDPNSTLRLALQEALVVEAPSYGMDRRWGARLPRAIPPDSIVFRGIEGHSYRQGEPARLVELEGRCVVQVVALYDVSYRVTRTVSGGELQPPAPAIRLAELSALAVALATTDEIEKTAQAATEANQYRLNPDSVPDRQDPKLADPTYELAGVFMFLGEPQTAQALYLDAERGRADPGYEDSTRERYGLGPDDSADLATLVATSHVLVYMGLARAFEAQGLHESAAPWRERAQGLLLRTDLVVDTVPAMHMDRFEDPWARNVLEFNGSVGIANDEPEYRILDVDIIRRDAMGTIRVGYLTDFRFFAEGHLANSLIRVRVSSDEPGLQRDLESWFLGGNVGFNLVDNHDASRKFQLFLALGAEAVRFTPDRLETETDLSWIYGLGARYVLSRHVAIRSDLRMHHVVKPFEKALHDLAGLPPKDLQLLELSVGVSLLWWPGYPYRESDRQRREAAARAQQGN